MRYLLYFIIFLFIGCSNNEDIIYLPPTKNSFIMHPKPLKNPTKIVNTSKLKPYEVMGRWYYPRYVNVGEVFRGVASWYGPDFHGKLTANGEIYNMYDYTAANKIMPLGTIVKVTNLNNNKSVVVRINDRGPFVKDRIIDLSYVAGKKIGIDKTGTAPVEIVVLKTPQTTKSSKKHGKIKIQIGSFKKLDGAQRFKLKFNFLNKKVFIKQQNNYYKVFIGYFNDYTSAKQFKEKNNIKGFIVK